jgi:hypothetical protein
VGKVPCRAVLNIKVSCELISGDSFLGVNNECNGEKPFLKGQVGIMENGSGCGRELV